MLPAPHLGGNRTKQDLQSKAHTAVCIVSPSHAGPIETRMLVLFLALLLMLLCCCIAHGPPGSVFVAVAVHEQPRGELSPLRQPQTVLVCMCTCLCALLYVPSMCAWRLCCHNISIQEQHSSSCTTAGSYFKLLCQ